LVKRFEGWRRALERIGTQIEVFEILRSGDPLDHLGWNFGQIFRENKMMEKSQTVTFRTVTEVHSVFVGGTER
jgi:hypothetical protein